MNLRVSKDGEKHRILDPEDHVYGTYSTQEAAEKNRVLWEEYFAAPLVC